MAWTLCSPEDVASLHPISVEDIEDTWSDMVEGLIRSHTGQPFLGSSSAISDEVHSGDGSNILRVSAPPIVSVTSLQIDDTVLDEDEYYAYDTTIQLKYVVFPRGSLNVKVSYVSGMEEVPDDIRLAAAAMIVAIINYRKRHGADASLKWGTANQKAGEESPNLNVGLTSHLVRIMKQILKRPRVRAK